MKKNVYVSMTEDQAKQLKELHKQVAQAALSDDPGSIMAQVYIDPDSGWYLSCRFVPGDEVRKMHEVLGLDPPDPIRTL